MGLIGLAPEGSPWPFWFSSAYLTQTLNRQSSIGGESPEWPNVTPPHNFRYMRVWRRVTDLMTISVGYTVSWGPRRVDRITREGLLGCCSLELVPPPRSRTLFHSIAETIPER